jgi:dTDP-4-dehydrorhamnose reductase
MKILLLGKNGQVGWELQRSLAPLGELIALDARSQNHCGDLTDLAGLTKTLQEVAPDVILNAAAYTAVDKAESEPELAQAVNAKALVVLAQAAKASGAWLVHYSTDYVFDGSGDASWLESDVARPLSAYGASKLAGEQAIIEAGCKHLIFRTSWVYASRGRNFAKTMLQLAQQRDHLNVINDQVGAPTGADLLADVTAQALRSALQNPQLSGLYHLTAAGETTWHAYATYVIEQARQAGLAIKVAQSAIQAVPSSAFPTPAQRPLNSRLSTNKICAAFNLAMPAWQDGVARMLSEVLEN